MLRHVFIDVFIPDGCLDGIDPQCMQCTVQTQVRHDGGHDGVGHKLSSLLKVLTAEVEDVVACDDISPLVHC